MFEVSTVDSRQRLANRDEVLALVGLLTERHAGDAVPPMVDVTWHDGATAHPVLSLARRGDLGAAWIDRTHRAVDDAYTDWHAPGPLCGTDGRLIAPDTDMNLTPAKLTALVEAFLNTDPGDGFVLPDVVAWEHCPLPHRPSRTSWLPDLADPGVNAAVLRWIAGRAAGFATALTTFGCPDAAQAVPRLRRLKTLLEGHAAVLDRETRWKDITPLAAVLLLTPIAFEVFLTARGTLPWELGVPLLTVTAVTICTLAVSLALPALVPALTPATGETGDQGFVPSLRATVCALADDLTHLVTTLTDIQANTIPGDTTTDMFLRQLDDHTRALSPVPTRLNTWSHLL